MSAASSVSMSRRWANSGIEMSGFELTQPVGYFKIAAAP